MTIEPVMACDKKVTELIKEYAFIAFTQTVNHYSLWTFVWKLYEELLVEPNRVLLCVWGVLPPIYRFEA